MMRSLRSASGGTGSSNQQTSSSSMCRPRRIEELDVCWFEEPVPPEDLEGYRQVKSALRIPIAGGEAEFTRWGFRPILVDRVLDILQPDVCAAGGLSECKKICGPTAFGLRVNPHVW